MSIDTEGGPYAMEAGLRAQIEAMLTELENFPLIDNDGEPLDSPWHRACINLLIASILSWFRSREDFYVGGNMFVYFSLEQARDRDYRGPDFFFVEGTRLRPQRLYWATWLEEGRYPDVIVELLSPTTEREGRTTKFALYERTFRTRNYFLYDPLTRRLDGFELRNGAYVALQPNAQGRLWCAVLKLWVGTWEGEYLRDQATWLRFFDESGQVVPVAEEVAEEMAAREHQRAVAEHQRADAEHLRADAEHQRAEEQQRRAESERQRADAAEAELARLRAQLARQPGQEGPGLTGS
jgi:Uma2 family endonuclease